MTRHWRRHWEEFIVRLGFPMWEAGWMELFTRLGTLDSPLLKGSYLISYPGSRGNFTQPYKWEGQFL